MKFAKHAAGPLVLAVALVLALAACAPSTAADLVPEDTIFLVQAKNPQKFLASVNELVSSLDSGLPIGGENAIERILALSTGIDLVEARTAMDFEKELLLIFSGSSPETGSTNLLIPVKDSAAMDTLSVSFGLPPANATYNGWNVYTLSGTTPQYPLSKPMDLGILDSLPDSGIDLLFNYSSILNQTDSNDLFAGPLNEFMEFSMDIAKDLDKVAINLSMDKKAIQVQAQVSLHEGGELSELYKSIKPAGSLAFLNQLTSDETFGLASSVAMDQISQPFEDLYAEMFSLFGLSNRVSELLRDNLQRSMQNVKGQGFTSFTMNSIPNLAGFMALGPEFQSPADILTQLSFEVLGAYTVKDTDLDKEIIEESIAPANALLSGYFSLIAGISSDLSFPGNALNLELTQGSSAGSEYQKIAIVPSQDFVNLAGTALQDQRALIDLMELLSAYLVRKPDTVYIAMGTRGPEAALALSQGSKPANALVDLPGYAELQAYLHDSPVMLQHWNIGRLLQVSIPLGASASADSKQPGLLLSAAQQGNNFEIKGAFLVSELSTYIGLLASALQ